jgi:hypothetical protein
MYESGYDYNSLGLKCYGYYVKNFIVTYIS